MVLLSLAIIFLPSLFHRDHRVEVDQVSLIPPKPSVEPIVISRPEKSSFKPAPTPEKAFQPPVPNDVSKVVNEKAPSSTVKVNANKESSSKKSVAAKKSVTTKSITPKPALNDKGLPNAWVVQLGSFKSNDRASELKKRLLKADYKAYARPVTTSKGKFFRVFVGPYIDKASAEAAKKRLDPKYKVKSRILTFSPE